jgi:hypothetical protein
MMSLWTVADHRPMLDRIRRLVAEAPPSPPAGSPRVLFMSLRSGWTTHLAWETLMAQALRLRGADCSFLICGDGEAQPQCGINTIHNERRCGVCAEFGRELVGAWGFPLRTLRDLAGSDGIDRARERAARLPAGRLASFRYRGLPLGRLIQVSLRWYFMRAHPEDEPRWEEVQRGFLAAGMVVADALEAAFERLRPERLVTVNGLFFAERIAVEMARRHRIPFTTYETGQRLGSLIFRANGTMMDRHEGDYAALGLGPELRADQEARLDDYLARRFEGRPEDYHRLGGGALSEEAAVRARLGLEPKRPTAALFTHIEYDSALQKQAGAFDSMTGWIDGTIRLFERRPQAQLVIRVHPGEVKVPRMMSRAPVARFIAGRFPALPPNVRVVGPEEPLSSYALMRLSDVGLVYGSTTGLEMALMGKPVVVVAEAPYRGRGFTHDARRAADYARTVARLLKEAPRTLEPDARRAARRFAYFHFFQQAVEFTPLRMSARERFDLGVESMAQLAPGGDPRLDAICDGILHGAPVVAQD